MRDALIEILELQVVTPQRAAIELGGLMGRSVSVFEANRELESMADEGLAQRIPSNKGATQYSSPGGGYDPQGGGAA